MSAAIPGITLQGIWPRNFVCLELLWQNVKSQLRTRQSCMSRGRDESLTDVSSGEVAGHQAGIRTGRKRGMGKASRALRAVETVSVPGMCFSDCL